MIRAVVLGVVVMALGFIGCRGSAAAAHAQGAAGAPATTQKGRKILYWKSPMDPTFISKGPGKDPMGMELVPVYAGEAPTGPPGMVRIDPATVQDIGVKTVVVERKALSRDIRTVGRIAYDEARVRRVSPKIGGWIEQQYVNFPGQVVEKGEKLLEIYSPELVATEQEYLTALHYRGRLKDSTLEEAVAGSQGLVAAAETRLRYWNITAAQIKALRERGEITRTMVLHAPFKGIVVDKNVPEGGYLQPGQPVYGIADISTVWVYAEVYEYEAPWLRLGQEATMTLAYLPGVTYHGTVRYIYPYVTNKTRTIQVRMEFRNSRDFDLKPDMWTNVTLQAAISREGLAVPIQAVIRTGTHDVVLIALGGGRFMPRDVRLGAQAGEDFQVLGGLEAGERVVTSAQFLIDSESNLQAALSKMIAPQAVTPGAIPGANGPAQAPGGKTPSMPAMPAETP
jgi:membrane fusion protein, copper/silver efflux system